jgi:hypothetical protein
MNVKEESIKFAGGFRISNTSLRKPPKVVTPQPVVDVSTITFGYKPDVDDERDYKLNGK